MCYQIDSLTGKKIAVKLDGIILYIKCDKKHNKKIKIVLIILDFFKFIKISAPIN